ncbi:MAG: hypothetical protein EBS89_02670 [Proteobacteria bacterium]|nr:hypothetical protein [Pseudomonadota bacterium]
MHGRQAEGIGAAHRVTTAVVPGRADMLHLRSETRAFSPRTSQGKDAAVAAEQTSSEGQSSAGAGSARQPRMRAWIDVMRHLEPVMADYQRVFDAWAEGGVEGVVIGPLAFEDKTFTFDPNPDVYRRFGVEPPPANTQDSLWWRLPATDVRATWRRTDAHGTDGATVPADLGGRRALLNRMLENAKARGWHVWLFCPHYGAGPGAKGPILVDEDTRRVTAARLVDAMEAYPMADGALFDGPEWGYEIAPFHQNSRSLIFNDLPESVAAGAARMGYDYHRMVGAKDRLHARLHAIDDRTVNIWGDRSGGFFGGFGLLGGDPALAEWFAFRTAALTETFTQIKAMANAYSRRPIPIACGPRSAAWSSLAGYDYEALGKVLDRMFPKHYFWHRGFDGLYGSVARYVETLRTWNPGLSEVGALRVVTALFGIDLPEVRSLRDFDRGFPQAFFDTVVVRETTRAIAAMGGDAERVVPWVDSGRKPHDGEPFTAHDLDRMLEAAEGAGLRQFLYHHHGNLTPGDWAVISARCGHPWQSTTSPIWSLEGYHGAYSMPGYHPPDLATL